MIENLTSIIVAWFFPYVFMKLFTTVFHSAESFINITSVYLSTGFCQVSGKSDFRNNQHQYTPHCTHPLDTAWELC